MTWPTVTVKVPSLEGSSWADLSLPPDGTSPQLGDHTDAAIDIQRVYRAYLWRREQKRLDADACATASLIQASWRYYILNEAQLLAMPKVTPPPVVRAHSEQQVVAVLTT